MSDVKNKKKREKGWERERERNSVGLDSKRKERRGGSGKKEQCFILNDVFVVLIDILTSFPLMEQA